MVERDLECKKKLHKFKGARGQQDPWARKVQHKQKGRDYMMTEEGLLQWWPISFLSCALSYKVTFSWFIIIY